MTAAVHFDLDGTLLRYDDDYGTILERAVEATLGDPAPEFVAGFDEPFFEAFGALEPNPTEHAAATAAEAAGVDLDPAAFADALLRAETEASVVPDHVTDALATLAEEAALGVVTNGVPGWQRAKLRGHGIADRFDGTVVSYETGGHKPDPAPFEAAAAGIDADRHVMVGDSEEADVEGARAVGWEAVHLAADEPDGWERLPDTV